MRESAPHERDDEQVEPEAGDPGASSAEQAKDREAELEESGEENAG